MVSLFFGIIRYVFNNLVWSYKVFMLYNVDLLIMYEYVFFLLIKFYIMFFCFFKKGFYCCIEFFCSFFWSCNFRISVDDVLCV